MSVVLGIDGGGTNTRAAIVADGKIVGSGQSGSIKRLRVGAEVAEANLRAVLKEVFAQAGVKGRRRPRAAAWPAPACPASRSGSPRSSTISASNAPRWSATMSSPSTRPFREGRASCRSPEPAPIASAARPMALSKPPADGVRAWATKARATGSASTPFAARSTLSIARSPAR